MTLAWLEHAAKAFEPPAGPRWATPADLAAKLDPKFRRTPAIDLINEAFVETLDTLDGRLIVSMPPREGKSTLTTKWTPVHRLAPGTPFVLTLTRWRHDDLAGRLLAAEDGHLWTVVNIPARAERRPEQGQPDLLSREPGESMTSARGLTRAQWDAITRRSGPAPERRCTRAGPHARDGARRAQDAR